MFVIHTRSGICREEGFVDMPWQSVLIVPIGAAPEDCPVVIFGLN